MIKLLGGCACVRTRIVQACDTRLKPFMQSRKRNQCNCRFCRALRQDSCSCRRLCVISPPLTYAWLWSNVVEDATSSMTTACIRSRILASSFGSSRSRTAAVVLASGTFAAAIHNVSWMWAGIVLTSVSSAYNSPKASANTGASSVAAVLYAIPPTPVVPGFLFKLIFKRVCMTSLVDSCLRQCSKLATHEFNMCAPLLASPRGDPPHLTPASCIILPILYGSTSN